MGVGRRIAMWNVLFANATAMTKVRKMLKGLMILICKTTGLHAYELKKRIVRGRSVTETYICSRCGSKLVWKHLTPKPEDVCKECGNLKDECECEVEEI